MEERRLDALDALRGVAALVVLLHHCHQAIPDLDDMRVLHHMLPGGGAVLVFFVLSGLVLGTTLVRRGQGRYAPFIAKRVTRIWPTFAAAVSAAAILAAVLGGHRAPDCAEMVDEAWARPTTFGLVLEHLTMAGTASSLDGPIWSLVHEMRISVLFPPLVALTLLDWRLALALAAAATLSAFVLQGHSPVADSWLMTLRFVVLFVMGIALASHLDGLRRWLDAAAPAMRGALWVVSLALVATSPDLSGTTSTTHLLDLRIIAHGSGAAGVVLLCASEGRASRWLRTAVPMYFGRISYSLYLWHLVIVIATVEAFANTAPTPTLVLCGAALSIPIAHLSERWLEGPTTRAGRRLAHRLAAATAQSGTCQGKTIGADAVDFPSRDTHPRSGPSLRHPAPR